MNEDVKAAMKKFKEVKAVLSDGFDIEMLDALRDFTPNELTSLFNTIYETGYMVSSMRESIFVSIPNVEGTLKCNKHRTISIMSQITKILLRVIIIRVRPIIMQEISEEQFGFGARKGTRNSIFSFSVQTEIVIEVQENVYVCFVE